jgi:hypothetical protein
MLDDSSAIPRICSIHRSVEHERRNMAAVRRLTGWRAPGTSESESVGMTQSVRRGINSILNDME